MRRFAKYNALFQCKIGRGFEYWCSNSWADLCQIIRANVETHLSGRFLEKSPEESLWTLPCSGLNITLLYLNSEMFGPFGFACVTLNPVFRRVTCFNRTFANLGTKCKYATKALVSLMQTLEGVWENSKVCVNPSRRRGFTQRLSSSPKLHQAM